MPKSISNKAFLREQIKDEGEATVAYHKKSKHMNGRLKRISKDEARHKRTLIQMTKEQGKNLTQGYRNK